LSFLIPGVAVSEAVHEILERIQRLSAEDRLLLEEYLAEQAEAEWQREAEEARRLAREKGIDQEAIDRAVEKVRFPTKGC
jgi:ABC-type taurine transport system substrate-binding protein